MKKRLSILLAFLLFVSFLSGCASGASNNALIQAKDGAFAVTPQEYIDMVNAAVEAQGDSRYKTIPEFTASGEEIEICSFRFTLRISTGEDGYITELEFDWDMGSTSVNYAAPFILGCTIGALSPNGNGDAVWDKLDMMDTVAPKYTTSAIANGVSYVYDTYGHGVYNNLIIAPA